MKKGLIPVLLVFAVFAGCSKQQSNVTTDSTSTSAPALAPAGHPTTSIQPPGVVGKEAGDISITPTEQPTNQITFTANFAGSVQPQTVTVLDGPNTLASFSNAPGGNLNPVTTRGPLAGETLTIQARIVGAAYAGVVNIPPGTGANTTGNATSTYTDSTGKNSVTVVIAEVLTPTATSTTSSAK